MQQADIGLIGLGVMGGNLALNIAEKGFTVAVYNRTPEVMDTFLANAGTLRDRLIRCESLEDLVAAIKAPRAIILMIKAGDAVDGQIAAIRPLLDQGDTLIDCGNSLFRDTTRREAELKTLGINYSGTGVSGGEEGARHGPSIMVGGPQQSWKRVEKIFIAISAKYKGEACCAWMGPEGAGHFVKMIHNGIEYADMQMIAEVYGLMRDGLGMKAADIGKVFEKWNKGRLNSYLIEITAKVLATVDAKTRKPLVDVILDRAGQKGTGKWSVMAAQDLAVPATMLEAAVAARILSSMKAEREKAAKAYKIIRKKLPASQRAAIIRKLEAALYAGKIAAYAQGFAVMEQASKDYNWNLPLANIASIWREGCIIRSQFLGLITQSFVKGGAGNLLLAPAFLKMMKQCNGALRDGVALAAKSATPAPALSSALAYFDTYSQARGTANLIQGQRDFFGAHGFERIGEEGAFHGPWH